VHGKDAYLQAVKVTEALFSGKIGELNAKEISEGFKDVPSVELSETIGLIDALVLVKAASSKREAREFITNGAVSINGETIRDLGFLVEKAKAIEGQFTVIRRGKKNYYLFRHI